MKLKIVTVLGKFIVGLFLIFPAGYVIADEILGEVDSLNDVALLTAEECDSLGNRHQALKWYKRAAEKGNPFAKFEMAWNYKSGVTSFSDKTYYILKPNAILSDKYISEAVEPIKKMAEKGIARAQYYLAIMYGNGAGVEKNSSKSHQLYKESLKNGYGVAGWQLAVQNELLDFNKADPQKAIYWYTKSAKAGYVEAKMQLGHIYELGLKNDGRIGGPLVDKDKALFWYNEAAKDGHIRAYYAMASLLYPGPYKIEYEKQQRADLCLKGAEKGDVDAMVCIGSSYHYGRGVKKDYKAARMWFQKAEELEKGSAINSLNYLDSEIEEHKRRHQ